VSDRGPRRSGDSETFELVLTKLQARRRRWESHLLYQEMADYVDNTLSDVEREIADGL